MLQFNLNVSIVLREYPFLERFDHAAWAGVGNVEFWWPNSADLRVVAQRIRDAGLQVTMFNFDAGDLAAGERGFLEPSCAARRRSHERARRAGVCPPHRLRQHQCAGGALAHERKSCHAA